MNFNAVKAELAQPDNQTIEQILELNRLQYGPSDVLANYQDFIWRYHQSPAGKAVISVIRNNFGDIVGFIWLVPLQIRVKGRDYLAATGTNLVIHPDYRQTFGYVKLIRYFEHIIKENRIPFHFSFVSKEKFLQLCRTNPQTTALTPLLGKSLGFVSLVQNFFTPKKGDFINNPSKLPVESPLLQKSSPPLNQEVVIQPVEQFDDRLDRFWDQVKDKYSVMVIRNRAFLTWRFDRISGRYYYVLIAQVNGQIIGYIILKPALIKKMKIGLIMDLLVVEGELGLKAGKQLITQAESYFRTQGVFLLAGLMGTSTMEYEILRQSGYKVMPFAMTPRKFRFAFFVHDPQDQTLNSLTARDWFITLADYESQ